MFLLSIMECGVVAQLSIKFLLWYISLLSIIPLWCSGITSGCNIQLTGWSPVQLWAKGLLFGKFTIGEWLFWAGGFSRVAGSGEVTPTAKSCFAMGIRGWARLLSSNGDKPRKWGEKEQVLATWDANLLAIGSLYDQARGQNAGFACFYVDFAARITSHQNRSREVLD